MATYNIPGITTSLIDNSYLTTNVTSGRCVLIAGFSKYGSEEIMEFSDSETVNPLLGTENYKKYGLGLKYIKGALTVTNKVLWKRLLPDDATYSNINIDSEFKLISKPNVIDINTLNVTETGQLEKIFNIFAKARGNGYDNLFVKFSPATDLEKLYANEDGDLDYRFNFLKCAVFENSVNGLKQVSGDILFSILDSNPLTGMPILNINTGRELYVNNKVHLENDFISCKINELFLPDLYEKLNLQEVTEDRKIILKDVSTSKNYELAVDRNDGFELKALNEEGTSGEILILETTNDDGDAVTKKFRIYIEDKVLKTEEYYGDEAGHYKSAINGSSAFWNIYINDDEKLDKEIISFPRFNLYNKLLETKFSLANGTDGKNLIVKNFLNMYGPGSGNAQNAKQLLIDFYSNNMDIKEVMYPKYDFDYIPDWSEDVDVMNSITNLGDELGFSIPLVSLGTSINPDEDYKKRQEDFFINSFNTLIYSGQDNLTHFDEGTGSTIKIPHSYMALLINLYIDAKYGITEPAANKNKGVLRESSVKLSYSISSRDIEKLREVQINTIIEETDGTYEIDQLTAYKKSSKLSRINVVKPIHRMRKDIPRLLKDFIQIKALDDKTAEIERIVSNYMSKYKISSNNDGNSIFKDVKIKTYFIDDEDKLIVSIIVNPVGTIETISVPIMVV